MEPNSAAEVLPALYRSVLDRVAEIAAGGERQLANDVRTEAIRIYSRAWDERARRELESLLRRHTAQPLHAASSRRGTRRRSVRAA
jgi:exonuclease I